MKEAIWKRFAEVVEKPYETASAWKKQNRKGVIGCFPMYVPEEMVHATGMLPITLIGSDEPITLADSYLQPFVCALARSDFDLLLKGELDFLDGLIFADICDPLICISDLCRRHKPNFFYHALVLPATVSSPSSQKRAVQEFGKLKAALETFTGKVLSDETLRQSIAVYNHNRALLTRLNELRRDNPALLSVREFATIVAASLLMPKEEHSQLLAKVLRELKRVKPKKDEDKVRLVLSGNLCEDPHLDLLGLVEEGGAVVVDDDLYIGTRYFATPVDENGDPVEALAQRYLDGVPCPTKHNPSQDWGKYLVDMARKAEAQGVVILVAKFCDPHLLVYPYLRDKLTEAGIPHLLLETEQGKVPLGPMRTRIQAFVERLR